MIPLRPEIDISAQVDALVPQMLRALNGNPAYEAALAAGELTAEASAEIETAMLAVMERNRRIAATFLEDPQARAAITHFWFARSFAAVKAGDAYKEAFAAGMAA